MENQSITCHTTSLSERIQKLQKLIRVKRFHIPHTSVLSYLGITREDAKRGLLCELDRASWDEDYGNGLYILRARSNRIISAVVCLHGGFDFTTVKDAQDLPYLPSRGSTTGRISYVFRKDITELLAQSRLWGQDVNVLSVPDNILDEGISRALSRAPVYVFDDESYWADKIIRKFPGARRVPLPWGKDFFTWILEGGDIQKLAEYAGSLSPRRIVAQLLEKASPGRGSVLIPTLSSAGDISQNSEEDDTTTVTTLNKVKDIRRILEAIPQEQTVAVYLEDDVTIHLSWMNRNYLLSAKSDVLRYLSAKVVCSDAYAQRRRLEAKGYSGILECTKLMRLALGRTSERGTDWHFSRVELPGYGISESILLVYSRLLSELEKEPAQYEWYRLMRDAQIPLAHGYCMPYNQAIYNDILDSFDLDEHKWRESRTWVIAKRYGEDSLPVKLYPCGSLSGRFACREPAMQGVPKELRAAFFSHHGTMFVGGDFSQCELRILAALSNDEGYLKIFENGAPHSETARVVLHKPEGEISKEERQIGKKVNLSIVYGIGNKKLAEDIGCTEKTARKFKQRLYMKYPKLKHWLEITNTLGATTAFVRTPSGRQILIDPSKPSYGYIDSNYVAQGTEMEIMLRAINSLTAVFREQKMDARVVHMIHDEIIVEARTDLVDEVKLLLPGIMTRAFVEVLPNAPVKNLIEVSASKCWGELKV